MELAKYSMEARSLSNHAYRRVINTTKQMQIVLMSLRPKQEIPRETHHKSTQFIRVESGRAVASIGDDTYHLQDGDCLVIPAGSSHYLKNSGNDELKLYTIYAPPAHEPDTWERLKPNKD